MSLRLFNIYPVFLTLLNLFVDLFSEKNLLEELPFTGLSRVYFGWGGPPSNGGGGGRLWFKSKCSVDKIRVMSILICSQIDTQYFLENFALVLLKIPVPGRDAGIKSENPGPGGRG